MNEQFSAFLDNEATLDEADSVVHGLLHDESMRESWCRQHWIREVLRTSAGEPTVTLDLAFSERVMQSVRDDDQNSVVDADALAAETAATESASADYATVVHMPKGRHRRRLRGMAGFAVAASAAGFALFVAEPMLMGAGPAIAPAGTAMQSARSATTTANGATMVASAGLDDSLSLEMSQSLTGDMIRKISSYETPSQASVDHWEVSNPVLANRLNSYLVEHSGLARGYGLGATTPGFIRVATYGQSGLR